MIVIRTILIIKKKRILEHPILVELEASQKHWDNNDDDKKYVKVPTNSRVTNNDHKKITQNLGGEEATVQKILMLKSLQQDFFPDRQWSLTFPWFGSVVSSKLNLLQVLRKSVIY